MADVPSQSNPPGHDPAAPHGPSATWRSNARFAADIVNTLAVPLLTLGATIVGVHLTNSLKEREIAIAEQNNQQSVQNQREASETSLRSAMFKELVGPLLQTEGGKSLPGESGDLPRAQRLALLAELLTLNFHEHFELGPLLRYVDSLPGQTEDARARLRGTARRVVSRQLAPMLAVGNGERTANPGFFEISLNSDVAEPPNTLQSCAVPQAQAQSTSSMTLECSSNASGSPLRVTSPDGKDRLQVSLRAARWDDQTVGVYVLRLDRKNAPDPDAPPVEFTLTPYSFPFSDNTLLPSGNRFGIYLTRVDNIPDVARVMRLSFVWFPKDFVPPRERPLGLDLTPASRPRP
jgi:hypothetical protein